MNRTICSLTAILAIAIAPVALSQAHAASQLSCKEYGYQAVKQVQEAERANCNLTGPRWSKDLTAHVEWCRSVSPDAWLAELKARTDELKKCAASN